MKSLQLQTLLCLFIAPTSWALQQPVRPQRMTKFTQACASVALCTSILTQAAWPAAAATDGASIRVQVNRPYIVELVRNKQERQAYMEKVRFLADSAKYVVEPILQVQWPTDTKDFVKDALRGKADVKVNGLDFAVKVVGSEQGSVTVQLSSDLLPQLPVVGLPGTSPVINAASEAVSDSAPVVLNLVERIQQVRLQQQQRPPFWTTPIRAETLRLDLSLGNEYDIHRAITPLDVAGVASVSVGTAYGASYGYYLEAKREEERAAEERKQIVAETKKMKALTDVAVVKESKPAALKPPKALKPATEKVEVTTVAVMETPLLQTRVRRSFGQEKKGILRRLLRRS